MLPVNRNKTILFFLLSGFLLINIVYAQVPKAGNDTLLDVACWNTEWFGDATSGNGPSDETLQFNNVKTVISRSDVDVWGLEEISNPTTWNDLLTALPLYDGAIATFSQTQKTALIWKKSMFNLVSVQHVLTESTYNYDLAGRPPLEVVLATKNVPVTDTFYFYVIHLKAYADQASYDRRKNAAGYIKTFLDTYRKDKKLIVLGDWNDEVAGSTVGSNPSPFTNFLADTASYFFISKQLSDAGKKSYASTSGRMIDHIMIGKTVKGFYVPSSSMVMDYLPTYVNNYSNTTSDHYPVMGFFNTKRSVTTGVVEKNAEEPDFCVFPNPASGVFFLKGKAKIISITDVLGRSLNYEYVPGPDEAKVILQQDIQPGYGIIFVTIRSGESIQTEKIILQF